jgi:hypothetical protein
MSMLLLAGSVLAVAALLLGAILSLVTGAPVRAAVFGAIASGWTAVYTLGVVIVSLGSHDRVLAPGEPKYFCGFYFDCHIGVAVLKDEIVDSIGARKAAGVFHVVTLRFESSARRETLSPWRMNLELQAPGGAHYPRDLAAEAVLEGSRVLEQPIGPGGSYLARVVYDVPATAHELRMFADQGPSMKIPEILLAGDEASILHKKTFLALPRS